MNKARKSLDLRAFCHLHTTIDFLFVIVDMRKCPNFSYLCFVGTDKDARLSKPTAGR